MRKPDDWLKLERLGLFWLLFWPRRGRALLRLSRRWREQDRIEWFCT